MVGANETEQGCGIRDKEMTEALVTEAKDAGGVRLLGRARR